MEIVQVKCACGEILPLVKYTPVDQVGGGVIVILPCPECMRAAMKDAREDFDDYATWIKDDEAEGD